MIYHDVYISYDMLIYPLSLSLGVAVYPTAI